MIRVSSLKEDAVKAVDGRDCPNACDSNKYRVAWKSRHQSQSKISAAGKPVTEHTPFDLFKHGGSNTAVKCNALYAHRSYMVSTTDMDSSMRTIFCSCRIAPTSSRPSRSNAPRISLLFDQPAFDRSIFQAVVIWLGVQVLGKAQMQL